MSDIKCDFPHNFEIREIDEPDTKAKSDEYICSLLVTV